jgi:hypothetical protein
MVPKVLRRRTVSEIEAVDEVSIPQATAHLIDSSILAGRQTIHHTRELRPASSRDNTAKQVSPVLAQQSIHQVQRLEAFDLEMERVQAGSASNLSPDL